MENLEELKEFLCDHSLEDTVVFENPDYADACIGISSDDRAVYSYDKMIQNLMINDGMTMEEAMEFIDYNTIRALPYAGPNGPIVVYDFAEGM